MKLLAIAVLLFACGKKAEPVVDHWPEVERMATSPVPGGDGALLDTALGKVKGDDVPETALEDAIAWRKAGGGLSWRNSHEMKFPVETLKLGQELLERRGDDEAVATVLYLAHRLRAESPTLIGVAVGFALVERTLETKPPWRPEYAAFTPTDAEIRRALAADAVTMVANIPADDADVRPTMTRFYGSFLVGAPTERAAFKAHVERTIAKVEKMDRETKEGALLSLIVMPRLPAMLGDFYKAIDDYHAWQGALPKP
jgi:hypothetical protein